MFNTENHFVTSDIELYKYVSEEDIMEYYYGDFIFNKHLPCPFIKEKTPSFFIIMNNNKIRWIRFGMFNDKSHNPIDLVMKLYNIKYHDALNLIYKDIYLNKNFSKVKRNVSANKEISNINIEYDIKYKDFELAYWTQIQIFDKEYLLDNNVFPVRKSFIRGKLWAKSKPDDPMYCYIHDKNIYTLYRPLTKDPLNKFRKVNVYGHIMGLENINYAKEHIIITKSYKDYLVLKRLDYNVIAVHTESIVISDELLDKLRMKFKIIAVLYDNDTTGIRNSCEFCKNKKLKNIILTEKDPFDFLIKRSVLELTKEIDNGLYK